MKRAAIVLAVGVVAILAARVQAADEVTANTLKQIGLAYHNHFSATNKAPAKAEDLLKYLDNNQKLVDLMKKDGPVVFIFDVGILDMTDGTSNTILAYVKEVPKEGGLILLGDGSVKKVTAEEFKKAILAKPKKK